MNSTGFLVGYVIGVMIVVIGLWLYDNWKDHHNR